MARELSRGDVPCLQAFYDANPEYFIAINGCAAPPDAAATDFDERPPPHLSHSAHPCLGLFEASPAGAGALAGVAIIAIDLGLPGVWHLALFIIATRLHGGGAAQGAYAALERWAHGRGASYLRLGVVLGHARAECFWQRQGFVELRRREGIDTGGRINTLRTMLKALGSGSVWAYLEAVPRDRPGSPLP